MAIEIWALFSGFECWDYEVAILSYDVWLNLGWFMKMDLLLFWEW